MSTSVESMHPARARRAIVRRTALAVDLHDGRTIIVPVAWYPRLLHGTDSERAAWELIGDGEGIRWPALDEDISVEGLLAGRPSRETAASLARWLEGRKCRADRTRGRRQNPES